MAKRCFRIKETSNSLENPQSQAEPEPPTECDASIVDTGTEPEERRPHKRDYGEMGTLEDETSRDKSAASVGRNRISTCISLHAQEDSATMPAPRILFSNWSTVTTVPRAPASPLHCRGVTPLNRWLAISLFSWFERLRALPVFLWR